MEKSLSEQYSELVLTSQQNLLKLASEFDVRKDEADYVDLH